MRVIEGALLHRKERFIGGKGILVVDRIPKGTYQEIIVDLSLLATILAPNTFR
jgi:hypothetical protein